MQILAMVDQAFMAGAQRHTVKLVMKRLKATQGRLREEAKTSARGKVWPSCSDSGRCAAAV